MNRSLNLVCCLFLSSQLWAQNNTLSPYSIYGLGDSPYSSLAAQAALSHTSIAFLSAQNINIQNPATLTYINKPTFNFDFRNEMLSLSNGGDVQTNNLFSIENFSFAFPLINDPRHKRRAAFTFGLRPYSRQGYNIVAYDQVPELGDIEYRFIGEGGINAVFVGFGHDLLADSSRTNVLSVGIVGSYVFGTTYRNRITMVDSAGSLTGSNIYRKEQNLVSGFDFRAGLLYTRKLYWSKATPGEKIGSLSVGGYYQPAVSLSTVSSNFTYSFANDYTAPVLIDSISYSESSLPTIAPAGMGLGVGFTYENKWNLVLDISTRQWSKLEMNGVNNGLNDELRVSAGVEHIPDPSSYKQLTRIMRYRAGLSFEQTRLNVNGIQPQRLGISAGLGIPILASKSSSIFNLGIEYARRGAKGLPVRENYFNVHIGLTLTPNQFDRWFLKRKYD